MFCPWCDKLPDGWTDSSMTRDMRKEARMHVADKLKATLQEKEALASRARREANDALDQLAVLTTLLTRADGVHVSTCPYPTGE